MDMSRKSELQQCSGWSSSSLSKWLFAFLGNMRPTKDTDLVRQILQTSTTLNFFFCVFFNLNVALPLFSWLLLSNIDWYCIPSHKEGSFKRWKSTGSLDLTIRDMTRDPKPIHVRMPSCLWCFERVPNIFREEKLRSCVCWAGQLSNLNGPLGCRVATTIEICCARYQVQVGFILHILPFMLCRLVG